MRTPAWLLVLVAASAGAAALYGLSQREAAPAPQGVKATTSAAVQDSGRWRYPAGGFSLRLPQPFTPQTINAGVNRILRVHRAGQPVVVFNSGPVYPWMRREDLSSERWRSGEVRFGGVRIPFAGDWAFRPGEDPRLLLLDQGRLVIVSTPQPERWGDPAVQAVIASFQPLPGADLRSAYRRLGRDAGDPRLLKAGIARSLAAIAGSPLPLVARRGIAAHRAGKLDALDSWILLDLLQPTVRRVGRSRRAEQTPARACPVPPK